MFYEGDCPVGKMTLFGAMAMGTKIRVTDPRGRWFVGTITKIEMESGAHFGTQPNSWNVTLVGDDDVVTMFVRTVD
jgi:hypothetical protein